MRSVEREALRSLFTICATGEKLLPGLDLLSDSTWWYFILKKYCWFDVLLAEYLNWYVMSCFCLHPTCSSVVEYANNIRRYVTAAAMDENRRQMKDRYDAYLLEVFFASHHDNFVAQSLVPYVFTNARGRLRVFPAHFKGFSLVYYSPGLFCT